MGVKFTDELYKFGIDTEDYDFVVKNEIDEEDYKWEDEIEVDSEEELGEDESLNLQRKNCFNGKIEVTSYIVNSTAEPLSGVKVLLFRVDGCSPKLIDCKLTNFRGEVRFDNLNEGVYIISQPIDKCFFRNPIFIPGDKVVLNTKNREAEVAILNRLRRCNNNCGNFCCGNGFWILFLLLLCGGCGFGFMPFFF